MYWKIEPYNTSNADCCVMPAETEEDHSAALEYAQARLKDGWDRLKPGQKATVTIELCDGKLPSIDYDPGA